LGQTELDEPIDLRSEAPARARRANTPPMPPAESGSDTGLKVLLAGLVLFIVALLIAIVVGIMGAFSGDAVEPDEAAEMRSR
jgi:hypothetical protein